MDSVFFLKKVSPVQVSMWWKAVLFLEKKEVSTKMS
jgi:hypothetical protein